MPRDNKCYENKEIVFSGSTEIMIGARKNCGSYRERIVDNITDIPPADFLNPWTFCQFLQRARTMLTMAVDILATSFACYAENCTGEMTPAALSRALGGVIFRCSVNRQHTKSSRSYSFCDRSNLVLQDIILFIKSYLDKNSWPNVHVFLALLTNQPPLNEHVS